MVLRNTKPSATINCIPDVSEAVYFQEQRAVLLERLLHQVDFSNFRVLVIGPNAMSIMAFFLPSVVALYCGGSHEGHLKCWAVGPLVRAVAR